MDEGRQLLLPAGESRRRPVKPPIPRTTEGQICDRHFCSQPYPSQDRRKRTKAGDSTEACRAKEASPPGSRMGLQAYRVDFFSGNEQHFVPAFLQSLRHSETGKRCPPFPAQAMTTRVGFIACRHFLPGAKPARLSSDFQSMNVPKTPP